ncbi:E3 binding domain-containing protein, partial [Alkalihalophilus pseudofirmus]
VRVGDTIAVVDEGGREAQQLEQQSSQPVVKPEAPVANVGGSPHGSTEVEGKEIGQRLVASPAARKLARERGINLQE